MRKRMPLEGAFMAHLAVEKALKALVAQHTNEVPPTIHNLVTLAALAKLDLSPEQLKFLTDLSAFNIQGRYPSARGKILKTTPKEFFRELPRRSGEFIQWCTQQLN
ncbi:MAG: HEPN domain-containing protein [Alicyclobacillaceae bacterium]|nr:HEPN domain-containing protein [Alicyclobacillaceae bacterium]